MHFIHDNKFVIFHYCDRFCNILLPKGQESTKRMNPKLTLIKYVLKGDE